MVSGAGGSGIGGGVGGGDGGTVTGDGLCSVAYRSADAPVECDRKGGRGGRERRGGREERGISDQNPLDVFAYRTCPLWYLG